MTPPQSKTATAGARKRDVLELPPKSLHVLRRLEVGPVRVEPGRLLAPYTATAGDSSDTMEFVYRFEEDVFDPQSPVDGNLACMMAAQVALNYGLFATEIVFYGPFDVADQRFLRDMAENTAREIYVKKFLEPNPFLIGDVATLAPRACQRYCRARLKFPDVAVSSQSRGTSETGPARQSDRRKHLILSSGGKDSLLSFGLLREAGFELHPVFINESGKHWFTALNAYRSFRAEVPNTGRVWTNSDRVFSWMLRQLPFIRKDFLNVRSDEYPIRLWTVAVFLFGALPIVRKRGIGRIVIGDEFDTTERSSFMGITHYNGLFDQSRYFDNAMTRYFMRKGWSISQFSILRPLSELLIEKTLSERYPDLLRLQVSCHAAHKGDEAVSPCGRCEKCRRIVGMLKAVGADPKLCGYTEDQIETCLRDLVTRGVHQEADGAQHLAYLLAKRKLIAERRLGEHEAFERPDTLRLRFETERSPLDAIPPDLRGAVFPLLMAHAQGAVQKSGRMWIDMDPLKDEELSRPYPFEKPAPARREAAHPASDGKVPHDYLLGHLTWPEARDRFRLVDVALLPVGAIEQHGPHLPLDTDAFDADYMAREVAKACLEPRPIVLPLISYGVSYHHDDFSGTISVSNETLAKLVYEIGVGVARNGITKLVIINGHGGNAPSLHFAAQMINRDAHIFTCVDTGETSDADVNAITETPSDIHAGEIETSTALANRPDLVRMQRARKYMPRFSSRYLDFSSKRSVDWYARTSKISSSGVMGDPTKASAEKGQEMWAIMIRNMTEFVEHLKSMSLDEIHQRNRF